MQALLACMLLLCLTCGALCTGKQQASLNRFRVKNNRQSAPYWHVSMTNLCRLVSAAEPGGEGEGSTGRSRVLINSQIKTIHLSLFPLFLYLSQLLRDSVEYSEENSDAPLKRKSPYILKRQAAHNTKSRRPYILKRSSAY
uniref:Neurotensin/neuromedin N n=1 Tax=Fundulus heteroclitus TaxID=8078 RepID=A0A3Q2UNK1_FUNHE